MAQITDIVLAGTSKVVLSISIADFRAIQYLVTVSNQTAGTSGVYEFTIAHKNPSSPTVFSEQGAVVGDVVSHVISAELDLTNNVEVSVNNTEADDVTVDMVELARIE
ncbi:MAG: hypothetical protein BV459_00365 [Thermoplasmata archaeon M11B2D]|nr:MAG: hypothetical protein BV459_00365 [Thermoplasmata archaeon M11B2D]